MKPQNGNKANRKGAKWICNLFMYNMIRYRFKLTNMLTGEKNREQDCLAFSHLKFDDVFSDVLGKSTHFITNYIFDHPCETYDVALFVDRLCKIPMEEI